MGYYPWYSQIVKYSNMNFDDTIWKVFLKFLALDPRNSSYGNWKSPWTID